MTTAPPHDRRSSVPDHQRSGPGRSRRKRLTGRALPLAVLAAAAFGGGVYAGAAHTAPERRIAERFVDAWERRDYGGMYQLLSAASQRRTPGRRFRRAYAPAAQVATVQRVRAGRLRDGGDGRFEVPVRAVT